MHFKKKLLSVSIISLCACMFDVQAILALPQTRSANSLARMPMQNRSQSQSQSKMPIKQNRSIDIDKSRIVRNNDNDFKSTLKDIQEFELLPLLEISGYSGNATVGQTQVIFPFIWNQKNAFYGFAEGKMANDETWMGGAGFGYRYVSGERIYGLYGIMDYSRGPNRYDYWSGNIGLESLGQVWDFRINGYIPFAPSREVTTTTSGWAAQDFHNGKMQFTDNNESYDRLETQTITTTYDMRDTLSGGDIEIGRTLPHFKNTKVFLGGYFYDKKNSNNINGLEGRLQIKLNKYFALEVKDTYDNDRHNAILGGLRLTFGGSSKDDETRFGISSRLNDPIEHNFGTMADGFALPITGDIVNESVQVGEYQMSHDNLWFVQPENSQSKSNDTDPGNGTHAHPFNNLTPADIKEIQSHQGKQTIDKYPLLYIASGTYNLTTSGFVNKEGIHGRFEVPYGWSLHGRTSDFYDAAAGSARPTLLGGIDLAYDTVLGSDPMTIESIIIKNNAGDASIENIYKNATLFLSHVPNLTLKDVDIINEVNSFEQRELFVTAICAENSSINFAGQNLIESHSDVNNGNIENSTVYGIAVEAFSNININGAGTNIISNIEGAASNQAEAYGIFALDHTLVNFQNGTNTITVNNKNNAPNMFTHGVLVNNQSTIMFSNGNNNISSNCDNKSQQNIHLVEGTGIEANNEAVIELNGGTNKIEAFSNGSQQESFAMNTAGIYIYDHSILNVTGGHNFITNINSYSLANSLAISAESFSIINLLGGINNIKAQTSLPSSSNGIGESTGIYLSADSLLILSKNAENYIHVQPAQENISAYGIRVEGDGLNNFKDENKNPIEDLNQVDSYFKEIKRDVPGTAGNKIQTSDDKRYVPWASSYSLNKNIKIKKIFLQTDDIG